MADALPVDGYIPDLSRTVTEMRNALEGVRDAIFQTLGRAPKTTLTISAGIITPDRALHKINTEGSTASDDLTNIDATNVPDGFWTVIEALDPSRVVTLKHLTGGNGQLRMFEGADIVLNDQPRVFLEWSSTDNEWRQVFVAKQQALPAGLILGSIAPYTTDQSWGILAYGRVLSIASYPLIYAEVGDFHNTGGEGAGNFRVPDARDIVLVGRGNMGGSARGLITIVGTGNPGLDTTLLGATAGADRRTFITANMPIHNHAIGTLSVTGGVSPSTHNHGYQRPSQSTTRSSSGSVGIWQDSNSGATTGDVTLSWSGSISGSVANTGSGSAFPTLQPSMVVNFLYTTGLV